jgi:hypothetical protein
MKMILYGLKIITIGWNPELISFLHVLPALHGENQSHHIESAPPKFNIEAIVFLDIRFRIPLIPHCI